MANFDHTNTSTKLQETNQSIIAAPKYNMELVAAAGDDVIIHFQEMNSNHIPIARPRTPRVPSYLHGDRWNQPVYDADKDQRVYVPIVLSIGPYHHGKPQFHQAEELKSWMLHEFIMKSQEKNASKDRGYYYGSIMEVINEIRSDYEGIEKYNDEALATIILRDTCFLVSYMENVAQVVQRIMIPRLGWSTTALMDRDLDVLENQIPFWVIRRLLYLRFGKEEGDQVVYKHLSRICFLDESKLSRLPWKDEGEEPCHLLEAGLLTLLKKEATNETMADTKPHFLTKMFKCKKIWMPRSNSRIRQSPMNILNYPYRSVTYLKAKGIYFEPSSYSLRDVRFTSYSCYGMLQLPILLVSYCTKGFFSNAVTFELVLSSSKDYNIACYVNLMKSLIETPKDVKVLQEKGILCSTLGSDEEIVKAFKEINTHGFNGFGLFEDVKRRIDEHCNSKAKTWMSEFFHKYFDSPWTVIALFAATFILCLTFLQTLFTIHPPN